MDGRSCVTNLVLILIAAEGVSHLLGARLLGLVIRKCQHSVHPNANNESERTSGCNVEEIESLVPLSLSPICSVVDFSESGYMQTSQEAILDDYWRVTYLHGRTSLVGEGLSSSVRHDDS